MPRDEGVEWVLDISGKITGMPPPGQPIFVYSATRDEDGIVTIRYLNYVPQLAADAPPG